MGQSRIRGPPTALVPLSSAEEVFALSPVYRLIPRRSSAPVRAIQRRQRAAVAAPAAESEPQPEPAAETETVDYGALLKADLVEQAEHRGIDSSGTKADIIERLEADDDD